MFDSSKNRIKASRSFDKSRIVRGHVESSRLFALAATQTMAVARLAIGAPESARLSPPISTLRPIELRDLALGKLHVGRVLHGTLCVRPFRTAAIQTVLEDATGRAVLLAIYDKDVRDFGTKYCKGRKVAIKEPLFKQNMDGSVGVCVDNPGNVEDAVESDFQEGDSSENVANTGTSEIQVTDVPQANGEDVVVSEPQVTPVAPPSDDPADVDTADFLRTEGNSCHSKKDFSKAIEYYTQSIRCIELTSNSSVQDPEGVGAVGTSITDSRKCNQLLLAYSNRSEAWLQLESYGNALADSLKALELNAGHEKTILRKGRSLHGLRRYTEAISCLQGLLNLKTKPVATLRANILATIQRANHAFKQANLGIYEELDDYFRGGCQGFPPDCNDFLGPLEMRRVENRGRGLFLTKDVKEGELLLVSNALAVARLQTKSKGPAPSRFNTDKLSVVLEDLVSQLVELATNNPSSLHQMYSLQDSSDSPEGELPPLSLFSGREDTALEQVSGKPVLDVQRIRRIVGINALEGDFMWPSFGFKLDHKRAGLRSEEFFLRDETDAAGLWALPSFINHSCCPNSSWTHVGHALFVHASRDLKKGVEITCAYHDIFTPLGTREAVSILRGFSCLCPRCVLERKLSAQFPDFKELAQNLAKYDKCKDTGETPGSQGYFAQKFVGVSHAVESALMEHQHLAGLDMVKRNWVRASFIISYVFSAINRHAAGKPGGALPLDTLFRIMFAVHPGCELTLSLFMENMMVAGASSDAMSMITRVCRCMYGNHKTEILQAILKWYRALWKTQFKPRVAT